MDGIRPADLFRSVLAIRNKPTNLSGALKPTFGLCNKSSTAVQLEKLVSKINCGMIQPKSLNAGVESGSK